MTRFRESKSSLDDFLADLTLKHRVLADLQAEVLKLKKEQELIRNEISCSNSNGGSGSSIINIHTGGSSDRVGWISYLLDTATAHPYLVGAGMAALSAAVGTLWYTGVLDAMFNSIKALTVRQNGLNSRQDSLMQDSAIQQNLADTANARLNAAVVQNLRDINSRVSAVENKTQDCEVQISAIKKLICWICDKLDIS